MTSPRDLDQNDWVSLHDIEANTRYCASGKHMRHCKKEMPKLQRICATSGPPSRPEIFAIGNDFEPELR